MADIREFTVQLCEVYELLLNYLLNRPPKPIYEFAIRVTEKMQRLRAALDTYIDQKEVAEWKGKTTRFYARLLKASAAVDAAEKEGKDGIEAFLEEMKREASNGT